MNQVDVNIMGQAYRLACPAGGEAALTQAVAVVDREMCAIRDAGKVRARERIAVLAALNLAFQLTQTTPTAQVAPTASAPSPHPPTRVPAELGDAAAAEGVDVSDLLHRLDRALAADGNLL